MIYNKDQLKDQSYNYLAIIRNNVKKQIIDNTITCNYDEDFESLLNIDAISIINTLITEKRVLAIFCVLELIIVSLLILFTNGTKNIYHSKKVKLTNNLEIPAPVGDGQYRYSLVVAEKRL